jgi:hypothetical protein
MNNLAIGFVLVTVGFAIAAAAGVFGWYCAWTAQKCEESPFSTSPFSSFHTQIEVFVLREEGMLIQIVTILKAILVNDRCVLFKGDLSQRDLSPGDFHGKDFGC